MWQVVGGIPEKAPVVWFGQGVKGYLAGEKSRGIIKKNVNTILLGDLQGSDSVWHSHN